MVNIPLFGYFFYRIPDAYYPVLGVSARSSHVPTDEDLVYRGEWKERNMEYTIPRGYAIGMSCVITHHDESIFPDSHSFIPERWLGEPKGPNGSRPLSQYLVSFSRGSRACVGKDLALMELYVALATLFRRHDLELFETTRDDVDFAVDMVKPMPRHGSKGVRVVVK